MKRFSFLAGALACALAVFLGFCLVSYGYSLAAGGKAPARAVAAAITEDQLPHLTQLIDNVKGTPPQLAAYMTEDAEFDRMRKHATR